MKFKFANGHSINLWDSEYDKITISEGKITCVRPGGKLAVIEVPKEWFKGILSSPEGFLLKSSCCKAASASLDQDKKISPKMVNDPAPNDDGCGSKREFEEREARFGKLAVDVEALKRDIVKFNIEVKESLDPLLRLPTEVTFLDGSVEKLWFEIGNLTEGIKEMRKETYRSSGAQPPGEHKWSQPNEHQKRKKRFYK